MFSIWDTLIGAGSVGLILSTLPTLLNKKSAVPLVSSLLIAACLTFIVPCFYEEGLVITTITVAGQASLWWFIAAFRRITK